MQNKLGFMIDYYRKMNKLSLEELGNRINKSPSAVSRWIKGTRSPMVEDLIKLTDIFGVDVDTLLYGYNSHHVHGYRMYDGSVSAGLPATIDAVYPDELKTVFLPDEVMGKYAGATDLLILRVNGESMNRVIPDNSLVAIKNVEPHELKNNDIVVFANQNEFSMKRFINDEEHQRLIFRPDSTSSSFIDYIVNFDEASELKILGRVVVSIVNYE